MKSKKIVVTCFISLLMMGMIATCLTGYKSIGKSLYNAVKEDFPVIDKINYLLLTADKAVSDGFFMHSTWIDVFGGIQKCLHKNIIPDTDESYTVLMGSDNKLYFPGSVFENNSSDDTNRDFNESCASLSELYGFCNENNVELLYVTAPHKYFSREVKLPIRGVYDYYNDTIEFHNLLKKVGVPELNLMEKWDSYSTVYSDGFFITDHHWNIQTAFWGFQNIVELIGNRREKEKSQEKCFSEIVVENTFLGSMGTRVGSLYDGKDSISIISPAYDTYFNVTYNSKTIGKKIEREGSWNEAILTLPATYTMYITSDNPLIHVENRTLVDGRNILFVKDSFGVPVAAWLSCMYKNMWEMDLRYKQNESVYDFIKQNKIDIVVILYNPEVIGNSLFYTFAKASDGK